MSRNEIFLDASHNCMILGKVKKKELKAFSTHRTWVWTVHLGAGVWTPCWPGGLCCHLSSGTRSTLKRCCLNLAVVLMTPGES